MDHHRELATWMRFEGSGRTALYSDHNIRGPILELLCYVVLDVSHWARRHAHRADRLWR